jgi:hypothetical protein
MANIPIYPGSSSFFPGQTPFGFYDNDYQFQQDADKVAKFCAQRLGWPIENVELQDVNFYTAFEEAVTVYGNELYAYRLRDNYLNLEGSLTSSNLNQAIITPSMANIIRISEQYGTEAGVGGNVNWYSGSVILTGSQQDYDLDVWAQERGISGSNLEIKRVFYQGIPASADYYYGGGIGLGAGWGGFFGGVGGVAGYGYGANWFVTPLSYNVGAIQEVELADDILMSAFSFQLINNKLRIFPCPTDADTGVNFWFQYLLKDERLADSITQSPNQVSNVSNANYGNPVYSQINSIGRSWIFEYTLAIVKEMLGYVRGKYGTVPIPGAEVTLNQADLLSSSATDKAALIERLRGYFDETSRQALLERRKNESDHAQSELNKSPMTIFIG